MNMRANKAKAWLAVTGAAASASLAFPALAFADMEPKEGVSVIIPDLNETIPMLIAFIILVIILAKFGWPMFEGMLEKREKTIAEALPLALADAMPLTWGGSVLAARAARRVAEALQKSEEARVEAERTLAEYQKQLSEAKAQASQIIAEAKETGEAVRADITKQAQEESAAMIEKAKIAIEAEKKAAMAELQNSIADLSVDVASRLVATDLSDDEHRAIIERYISEAGSFHAN